MNQISFTLNGRHMAYSAPSKWNEATLRQLLLWMGVAFSELPEEERLELAVPVFFGMKSSVFKLLKASQRLQIAPSLRPLLEKNTLNKWLMPHFRLFFKKYYGPADKLSNITAHEFFNVCEPLFWRYRANGDEKELNALCATLFRPARKGTVDSDIREELTDAGIAKRARLFRFLPLRFKLAILFNYEGCRNFIAARFPEAFAGGGGKSKRPGDVTLALAGGPMGDLIATRKTNLYTFLLHLVNLIAQEAELKRK